MGLLQKYGVKGDEKSTFIACYRVFFIEKCTLEYISKGLLQYFIEFFKPCGRRICVNY